MRERILSKYCKEFKITIEDLISDKTHQKLADLRSVIAYNLRQDGYTYEEIGGLLKKHHTTIIHSVNKCKSMIKHNNDFMEKYGHVIGTEEERKYRVARNTLIKILRSKINDFDLEQLRMLNVFSNQI